MILGSRDEAVLGATYTLAVVAAQGAGSEAIEDEDQDMVCEDGHFIPLFGDLLLYLDEDLVEQGRQWKQWRCRLNQIRSHCEDVFVSSLIIRWKLVNTQMSQEGNKNPRTMHKGSAKALPLPLDLVA